MKRLCPLNREAGGNFTDVPGSGRRDKDVAHLAAHLSPTDDLDFGGQIKKERERERETGKENRIRAGRSERGMRASEHSTKLTHKLRRLD